MTEAELTALRVEFVRRLRGHDWGYQYADDSGAYHKGMETQRWLEATIGQLPDGVELWNAYAPVGSKRAAAGAT